MATLYIVGTPIGNLEDVTMRALRVLNEADVILCEDTRVTARLLKHYKIETQLLVYNEQKSGVRAEKIIELLKSGKIIALVTDSGTPSISDPGSHLISLIWHEFGHEISVIPIPGPSALTAALSVSGIPAQEFVFLGFLPHKKGRETRFKEIAASKRTVVFYESPHRILKTLSTLKAVLDGARTVVVARELTKIYEEIVSGSAEEVSGYFEKNPDKVRGEFVVLVSGIK